MFNSGKRKEIVGLLTAKEAEFKNLAEKGNDLALKLYNVRKSASKGIDRVEVYINMLANSPREFSNEVAFVKGSIREFNDAVHFEEECIASNKKGAGMAVGGLVVGGVVAAAGPTIAMAVATTFGVASTGTAIAALSGAAANAAALAWLGGGTLAVGGGGMVAGKALLAMAGPVGWAIGGALVAGGGLLAYFQNDKVIKEANKKLEEIQAEYMKMEGFVKTLEELIEKSEALKSALDISPFTNLYPNDYTQFSDEQKESLSALINNTKAMGELINVRIHN